MEQSLYLVVEGFRELRWRADDDRRALVVSRVWTLILILHFLNARDIVLHVAQTADLDLNFKLCVFFGKSFCDLISKNLPP